MGLGERVVTNLCRLPILAEQVEHRGGGEGLSAPTALACPHTSSTRSVLLHQRRLPVKGQPVRVRVGWRLAVNQEDARGHAVGQGGCPPTQDVGVVHTGDHTALLQLALIHLPTTPTTTEPQTWLRLEAWGLHGG